MAGHRRGRQLQGNDGHHAARHRDRAPVRRRLSCGSDRQPDGRARGAAAAVALDNLAGHAQPARPRSPQHQRRGARPAPALLGLAAAVDAGGGGAATGRAAAGRRICPVDCPRSRIAPAAGRRHALARHLAVCSHRPVPAGPAGPGGGGRHQPVPPVPAGAQRPRPRPDRAPAAPPRPAARRRARSGCNRWCARSAGPCC